MDIPPGLTQLGAIGIGALTVWALVLFMRPLLNAYITAQTEKAAALKQSADINVKLLAYLQTNDAVIDRNTAQAAKTETALVSMETALAKQTEALVQVVKAQPDTIAQIVKAGETQADRTITDLRKTFNDREAVVEAGIARIEASVVALRDEITTGNKAHRQEMAAKLNDILRAIDSLKPPPPPPQLVKPLHALEPVEKEEKAA